VSVHRRHDWRPVAAGTAATIALAPWMAAIAQSAQHGSVVTVDWVASDRCPDAAYVDAKIARLLAGAAADTPRLRARAVVVRDKNGPWRVDLSTESATGTGHRSVTAETCRAAADVTALVLALAVDPEGASRNRGGSMDADAAIDAGADSTSSVTAPSVGAATDAPAPEATVASTSNETQASVPNRVESRVFAAGVYVLADLGTLPYLGAGAGVRLAVIPPFARAARLEVGASLWAPQTVAPTTASLGGRFDLRSIDVAACWVPSLGRWELGACLGGELGWMTGSGISSGTGEGQTNDALWPILRPRVTGAYRLSTQWAVRGDLGLGVSLGRPQFRWEGVGGGDVQSPGVVAARADVGLEARF
jgi:hypothetical protein